MQIEQVKQAEQVNTIEPQILNRAGQAIARMGPMVAEDHALPAVSILPSLNCARRALTPSITWSSP